MNSSNTTRVLNSTNIDKANKTDFNKNLTHTEWTDAKAILIVPNVFKLYWSSCRARNMKRLSCGNNTYLSKRIKFCYFSNIITVWKSTISPIQFKLECFTSQFVMPLGGVKEMAL